MADGIKRFSLCQCHIANVTLKSVAYKGQIISFGALRKKNSLPVPVKKGQLKIPFSLVDQTIYLNSKKDVQAILPDVLGSVLARIWIDPEFRDSFKSNPQKTLELHNIFLPEAGSDSHGYDRESVVCAGTAACTGFRE